MRPASLRETAALIRQPSRSLPPPLDDWSPDKLVGDFLVWCTAHGIVGARDLRQLKTLCDEFADTQHVHGIDDWGLARKLAQLGIAHGKREMQPYEAGYQAAVLQSGSAWPQVVYFVMPRKFPFAQAPANGSNGIEHVESLEQIELLPEPPTVAAAHKLRKRRAGR